VPAGNVLYYGDNLDVLRQHIADEAVDLVYLDPPFNSNATYNVLFSEQDGSRAAAQVLAFDDTWEWNQTAVEAYEETVERGGDVAVCLQAMRTLLGGSGTAGSAMLAYLSMMAPRLMELRRVLKPTGSIYLHCDPTASHYLKLLMDSVFGRAMFRNEIVWCYRGGGVPRNAFARKHDVILFYAKTKNALFYPQFVPYSEASTALVVRRGGISIDNRERDLARGAHMPDWWTDINSLQTWSPERLGYPTQKPVALLERILAASSQPGDVVLDPFCGCGTAIDAAQRMGRKWIGIDITHLSINLIKHRLHDTFGESLAFDVVGEPADLVGARKLAHDDPYQFQWWVLGLVGARPVEQKKGADHGIDGRLFFHDEQGGNSKQVILSVKAGHVTVSHVRDLRGVLDREEAAIGVLVSMEPPTGPMRTEAADAGTYEAPWGQRYPRIQLLTVEQLLDGRGIEMPAVGTMAANVTYRRAQRAPRRPVSSRQPPASDASGADVPLFDPR